MTVTREAGSETLARIGESYFDVKHRYDPFNATLLGLTEFDGLVADPSAEASARAEEAFAALERELESVSEAELADGERLDRRVLASLVGHAREDARHSLWAANASAAGYGSRQGTLVQALAATRVADEASADRYLRRLEGLASFFGGLGERYREEAARGRVPTRVGVRQAIGQLRRELGREAVMLRPVADAAASEWRDRAHEIHREWIVPAVAALCDVLEQLEPAARDDDHVGIRHVEGGEEGYAAALRQHTTTGLSAEEIHRIGLEVLDGLEPRWAEIGASALGETDRARIAERLRTDRSLRFETRAEIVAMVASALRRAEEALPAYFPAKTAPGPCDIVELSAEESAASAMAYYRPPASDGSRNGAQCIATSDPASRHRYEYEALTFHESVPGHHLQLATTQLLDLPRYRRHLDVEVCGFNEGWGLYSEELADELGLYSSDLARLGMLSFRALRACRLVVDTGLHHFGWSRRRAVEFLWEHTATSRENVEHEVDRYIGWPGQACAYVIGSRDIRRLRARAEQALGGAFDLAAFHGAVVGNGAVPLSVLDGVLLAWQHEREAGR